MKEAKEVKAVEEADIVKSKKVDDKTPSVDYIKITYIKSGSKQGEKMIEELGHSADIAFRWKTFKDGYLTEIRIISDLSPTENLAHEFGHFIQKKLQREGDIQFLHDEDMSFLLEDAVRDLIRKRAYNLEKVR